MMSPAALRALHRETPDAALDVFEWLLAEERYHSQNWYAATARWYLESDKRDLDFLREQLHQLTERVYALEKARA